MKHLKYLLMAALVAMPLTACDEDDGPIIEPTPTGTITGTVSAEGAGLSGVSVTMVGATTLSATTGANGAYTFTNVEAGSYGIAIDASNHPGVSFSVTSKTTSITSQGQTSTVDFTGSYVRTAAILGVVTASGAPLAGVSVAVTGGPDNVTKNSVTNAGGEFSATGLRAGTYTVTLSNLPTGVTFTATTQSVTVATGESKSAHFPGQAVQLATISGGVTVDNVGIAGVAVALSGGATASTETGPGGAFSFTNLTPGAYTVTITPPEDTKFDVTSKDVTVNAGQTGVVNFAGVGPKVPATISIQSVTKGGTTQPVDLNNVFGQIDVSLNLRPNDQTVTQVDVLVDGEIVASQMFSAADLALMAEENPEAADVQVITLSFNTARYDVDTDTYTATARYENGPRIIGAQVHVEEAELPTAANTIEVLFNNTNTFHVLASREGVPNALDSQGRRWYGGPDFEITVYPIPVMYNGQVVVGMTANLRTEAGGALGSCGPATDAEAPFAFTWTCGGVESAGFIPVVTSTVTDAGEEGPVSSFGVDLNIANVANTADHPFPMRIDVRAPQPVDTDEYVYRMIRQTNILNMGNWLNHQYNFHGAATPATARTYNAANVADDGVGKDGVLFAVSTDTLVTTIVAGPQNPLTGADLAAAIEGSAESVTNTAYRAWAVQPDLLGNTALFLQEPTTDHPLRTFGYDQTAPLVNFSEDEDEVGNLTERYTILENFATGDNVRARATDNLSGFSDLTGVSHSLVWVRGLFNGNGAIQTGAIVRAPSSAIVSAPFATAAAGNRVVAPALVGAPNVDYVAQTAVTLAVNNLGTVIAGALQEPMAPARYYIYQIEVRDQAGNVIRDYRAVYVNNGSVPVIEYLANPTVFDTDATYTAGVMRDSVEVLEASLEIRYPNAGNPFTGSAGSVVWERPGSDLSSALRMNAEILDGVLFNDEIHRPLTNVAMPLGLRALSEALGLNPPLPFINSLQTVGVNAMPAAGSVATSKPDSSRARIFNGFGADTAGYNSHSTLPYTGATGVSALVSRSIQGDEIAAADFNYSTFIDEDWFFYIVDSSAPDCDTWCVRAVGPKSTFTNPFAGGPVLITWADDAGTGPFGEIQWRVLAVATPNFTDPFPTRDSGDDRLYEWTFSLAGANPGILQGNLVLGAIGVRTNPGSALLTTTFMPAPEAVFNPVFSPASITRAAGSGWTGRIDIVHGANSTGGVIADVVGESCRFVDASGATVPWPTGMGLSTWISPIGCQVDVRFNAVPGTYLVGRTVQDADGAVAQAILTVNVTPAAFVIDAGADVTRETPPGTGVWGYTRQVFRVSGGNIASGQCSVSPSGQGVTAQVTSVQPSYFNCRVLYSGASVPGVYTVTATGTEVDTGRTATDSFLFTLTDFDVALDPPSTEDDPTELLWTEPLEVLFDVTGSRTNADITAGTCGSSLSWIDATYSTVLGEGNDTQGCLISINDLSAAEVGNFTVAVSVTTDGLTGSRTTNLTGYFFLGDPPEFDPVFDIETAADNRRELERDRTANFRVIDGFGLGINETATAATVVVTPSATGVTAAFVYSATDEEYRLEVAIAATANPGNYEVTLTFVEAGTGVEMNETVYIRVVDSGAQAPGGPGL